jgi:3-isopropylmalate/(R)-2-methylmalate dehydratase large subunit
VRVTGRVLWLTEDPELLKRQLRGEDLQGVPALFNASGPEGPEGLIDNISTDEITPGWVCYYYDATLARYWSATPSKMAASA